MSNIYYGIKNWWGRIIIAALVVSLSGCAARPYRITNFFTSPAIDELREKRVAVLPFKNLSPVQNASDLVTDEFNLQIGKLGKFRLIERIRIQELLKEQDMDPERIDEATAVKIGKMLGAHAVILGTVTTYYPYQYKEKKEAEEKEKKELERARIEAEKAPKTVVIVEQPQERHPAPPVFIPQQPQGQEKAKDKEKDKEKEEKQESEKNENSVWIAIAVIGAVVLTAGILYFVLKPKPMAEAGVSVRMVNVETGEQLWQAKEFFKGDDPRIRALVQNEDKDKLIKDVEFLSQILCHELAVTIGK